ncbi:MAG TPA: carboxypeptidase-like regulatory domain-containing protein [Terriglobales bacterium]|nr:carboxypeptidase-like regulatory domain-containing protein [Terriglobales bacterium]
MRWRRVAILFLGLALPHPSSLVAAQTSALPSIQPAAGVFRIAGTVVNAVGGNPLARARVSIQDTRNRQTPQWVITSEDGRFDFKQLPAGKYSLDGAKRGFIAASYDQHEHFSTAIVTGAGVDTEHLVLRLAPYAVLAGKVLNEAGEPVRHAMVSLYVEDRRAGIGRIQRVRREGTDDQGSYEFAALDTGTYFIATTATPWYALYPTSFRQEEGQGAAAMDQSLDVAYPVTYYKDATEPDEASPIPIRGGDRLEADIHLSPVPALHLLFHVPGDGRHGVTMPMLGKPSFDGVEQVQPGGAGMVSPGVFEMTGVAAGRYTVRIRTSSPGELVQMSEVEMDLTTDGQELDAAKGEPASSVDASVKVLGEQNIPRDLGLMLLNSRLRVVAFRPVNDKGEVEFGDVTPGKYEVVAQASGKAYSVLRISSPGAEVSGHILDVTAGSSLTISLTLVGSAMRVEGFAKRGGQAAPGAMVVLVPANPETNHDLFRRDQSDLDGSFNLLNVIPGSYTVCAIENGWDLDWAKPAVITHYCEHGRGVIVSEQPRGFMQLEEAVEVQSP